MQFTDNWGWFMVFASSSCGPWAYLSTLVFLILYCSFCVQANTTILYTSVYVKVYLNMEFEGMCMSVTSGKTEKVSRWGNWALLMSPTADGKKLTGSVRSWS